MTGGRLRSTLARFLVRRGMCTRSRTRTPLNKTKCVHAHHGATKPGGSSSGGVCGSGSGGVGGVVGRRRTLRLPAADQAQEVRASGYSCRSGRKVHTAADCYGASSRAGVFGSCSAGLLAERHATGSSGRGTRSRRARQGRRVAGCAQLARLRPRVGLRLQLLFEPPAQDSHHGGNRAH